MALKGETVAGLRVVRKLSRTTRGAVAWTKAFGDGLVCVRHRNDVAAGMRYVTVELLVHEAPIETRVDQWLHLRIFGDEVKLHKALRLAGGWWDSKERVWRAPRRVVAALALTERIIAEM